ncbi:hypothetical protein H0H92_006304 [Tricholoma furcatifolium]|nr:hypothetical protein H0H92_006304 [Tricholoma furcatifolium]
MEGLRQGLDRLRTEVDKGVSRLKEANVQSQLLLATLKDRDNEIKSLQERLDLTKRILILTMKCEETRLAIRVNGEKIALVDEKVDQLGERLGRVECERDMLETQYLNAKLQVEKLEEQLDDLF